VRGAGRGVTLGFSARRGGGRGGGRWPRLPNPLMPLREVGGRERKRDWTIGGSQPRKGREEKERRGGPVSPLSLPPVCTLRLVRS
jgi:hypothetical protein